MMRQPFLGRDTLHGREVTDGQLSPSFVIVCPVCGFDYNRLTIPAQRWEVRGPDIALPIEGECGHSWLLCLTFHKGQSFLYAAIPAERLRLPDWVLRLHEVDDE
jgi:hypothetical protein